MRINTDVQKREQAHNARPNEGPLSKTNYERFYENLKGAHQNVGPRRAVRFDEKQMMDQQVILENPIEEEDQEGLPEENYEVEDDDNPLISREYVKIIEASIPKYTM